MRLVRRASASLWRHMGVLLACLALTGIAHADPAAIIQASVGQLLNGNEVKVAGATIASTVVVPAFYERRDFKLAWSDPVNVEALFAAIEDSAADGLDPEDYHLVPLQALRAAAAGEQRDADFDLLATDALVRLGYHLRFGKIDVARIDPDWNFRPDYEAILFISPVTVIQEALEGHRVRETLDALRPNHPLYAALRAALARYRAIQAAGGWPSIPKGDTIRPGARDARVPTLRARLLAEGDLAADALDSGDLYDETLQAAVRMFQLRHGLTQDAAVGGKTQRLLNLPVQARIDQLRLSLERARLIMHELPERFVVVNVPAFRLYYVREGSVQFATNVVVGKVMAKTPIFRAEMTHVVLNPSWTVPPTIVEHEILPQLQKHPDYLERKGLQKVGGQYVQQPGPNNALGRIKLMFPNPHFVYLHDTPEKSLFGRESRTFSHGCVRVQNTFDLAELVLDDPQRWSKAALLKAADTGKTQTINLEHRLPVLIAYWTAGVSQDGKAFFYDDVYNRDPAELKALNGPFHFHPAARSSATRAPSAQTPQP
jgi:murein L,D-transpeptidase YcbB/YkuD